MPAAVRSSLFGQSAALQNAGVKPEDAAGAAVNPANPKKNLRHRNIRARLHFQTCRPALRKQAPRNAKSATSESRKRQTFYIVSNRNHTNGYVCARVKYLRQFRRATAAESGACAPRGSRKKSDFGLEGGGAFALVSRRAERGEKFATPPGAVVAGFSARNAPTDTAEWARADKLDRHDDGKFVRMNRLYNLDAVAYESIMPGFFQIMYGEQNDVYADGRKPK